MSTDTLYVNKAATGNNDGSNWTDAFTDLQTAIDSSASNPNAVIWVAEGTYAPTKANTVSSSNDARDTTFLIEAPVKIYGGFSSGATALSDRDSISGNTILTGILSGGDAAYHVIFIRDNAITSDYEINGFKIINGKADGEGMQIEIPISKGRAEYVMLPGQPNITPDAEDPSNSYKKTISITADDLSGGALAQTTIDPKVIVEGFRARESTFTTVTPEIPLLILRDPPGDGSHSFLETSKSTELAMSLSTLKGGSVTTWSEVKVGAQFEAGFIGFSTETEVWGTIGASATVGASNTSTEEVVMTLTNNQRFQTSDSDDPDIMGADGDLFYGAAMNLRYAKSDIIEYDPAICKATARVELAMQNKEFETQFLYTAFSIRNSIIPSLEDLRDLQTEDSQIRYYQTQVDMWEQMLQRNDELKEQAVDDPNFNPSNISWSGGTVFDYSTSQESSSSIILEFLTEIDGEIATELGLEVAGSGISGGVNINMRMELGESKTTTQTEGRTTGFVLHDDDALDRFETGIKIDPVYKTPVFVNNSAITSCPYEPGTSPIDGPELFISEPNVSNVNIDAAAGYNFKLRNLSEDQKIRDYKLRVIPSSNPSGAVISIGNDEILFADMNYLEERDFFISVSRGPGTDPNVFTFEGIQFEFYPECDESQASIGTIRASFVSPCSDLTFSQPEPNWLLNQSNNDNLEIILRDYDKNALTQLVVQYANAGTNGWQVAQLIDPEDLDDNASIGTSINVSLRGLNDGNYDVRIKTVCDAGDTYTERRRGVIDREGPVVFGLPEPADDIYDFNAGDEISVEFEDVLDCTQVTDSDVTLIGLTNGNIITTQVSCVNNKILIIPTQALSTTDAYRVILDGITDVNHNNNESPIRWVFIGKDYVIDESCGPLAISNNNLNQDAISQSVYRATILETNGTIAPFTSINYKAEESILFDSGFEVVNGGELIAEIETCPK